MSNCKDPACTNGYIHEDGDVSICGTCTDGPGDADSIGDAIKALEEAATEAWRALDMMAEEAEERGDIQHAHWIRHRSEPLDRALADLTFARVMAMSEEELDAEMRAMGIDPDESFANFHAMVKRLCDEHRARSEASAQTRRVNPELDASLDPEDSAF